MISQAAIELAVKYASEEFDSGLNCAEATLRGLIRAGVIDMPLESNAIVCGFGGGGGTAGYTCGSLCAAIVALGSVHGRRDPYVVEGVEERRAYMRDYLQRRYNNLVTQFAALHGSALCHEICEAQGGYFHPERKVFCHKLVPNTVRMVCDAINITEAEARNLKYGPNIANYV